MVKNKETDAIRRRIEGDFTIGEFNISDDPSNKGHIFIYHFTGEGGGFNKNDLIEALEKGRRDRVPDTETLKQFYNDNF